MLWEFVESLRVSQSRTLPYISGTFVGRETELHDVLQLLEFGHSDTRVVSIDGPPGFGKSTLAIKVGHQMARKGTNVLYVNMLEVFSMQVLAEKVCKGAGIVIKKTVRIERMYHWARDLSYNTLLILDNCDDVLRTQKDDVQRVIQSVVESSPLIRVLMTSRYKAILSVDSYRYTLHELSHDSACQLLADTVKGNKLDSDTRGAIANLTGNVPLALRVIGSLLSLPIPPSPHTIIKELTQQPIRTLSPEELPVQHQVYASIDLSYKYLHQIDQRCGQFLAHFPGSFDEITAIKIMLLPNNTYCLPELVQRSLLGYNQRTEHFEFHRLIKEFFLYRSRLEGNSDAIQHTFNVNFQSHFAYWLSELADQFSRGHKSVLGALDAEKHNIRYFLDSVKNNLKLRNSFDVISALLTGLDEKFLECRFSIHDLDDVTKSATKYLQHNYKRMDIDPNTLFNSYVKLVSHWAVFRKLQHSTSSGLNILTSHQEHVEHLYAKANKSSVAAQYIVFYFKLSNYYEALGHDHQVLRCQMKILEATDSLTNCEPGSCDYLDIGVSYLNAGDNHQGVKYIELARQQSQLELLTDELQQAHILTWLHDGYSRIGAASKAEEVVDEMMTLLPAVVRHDVTMQNKYMFESLIRFYIKAGKHQEAGVLLEKILRTLMESHESGDPRTAQHAKELTVFLYSVGNYTKAAEIGLIALKHMRSSGIRDLEIARMSVLVGKSKLLAWDISGLHHFDDAINLIEEKEYTSNAAQDIVGEACMFRMWRLDTKCIWKVYQYLNSFNQDHEYVNSVQNTAPPESTSTAVAVHDQNNMFSVSFLSQSLPVNSVVQHIQSMLIGIVVYGSVVGHYIYVIVLIPIIFILTCWPCLTCGCIICCCCCHCCCCHCYYVCSRIWVCTAFIPLLPLLIGIYYPIVLLVYHVSFISVSFCLYSFIICIFVYLFVKLSPERFILEFFLPYIMFGDHMHELDRI